MDNRPIKFNKSGKYPIVLDPTNDIAAYYSGLDDLKDLIQKYFETIQYQKPIIRQGSSKQTTYKKSNKEFKNVDTCSVCLIEFKDKQKIKILECKHCFHDECVMKWFSEQPTCPNCRFSLAPSSNDFAQQQP